MGLSLIIALRYNTASNTFTRAAAMTDTALFGLLSTLMVLASRVFYFKCIFKDGAKPHAFSWLIWGTISAVGFAAQVAEGAGPGAWARGFACATCFILVVIGYQRGDRSYSKSDWVTLLVSLSAIPLWVITKSPLGSVILVCIIDTVGYLPTLRKAWVKPHEEPAGGYAFFAVGALLSLFAIEHFTPSTWLYPVVMVLSNTAMTFFLILRRQQTTPVARML
jgi:hypothetical protein